MWTITIDPGRTSPLTRIARTNVRSSHPASAGLSPSPRSVAHIITTNASPPDISQRPLIARRHTATYHMLCQLSESQRSDEAARHIGLEIRQLPSGISQ